MKRIINRTEYCVGCGLCRINCIVEHSHSKHVVKAFLHENAEPTGGIKVHNRGSHSMAIQCQHCENPSCISACISGALHKEEDGFVVHDAQKCIGCYACILACPFGSIRIKEKEKKIFKCDLCRHRTKPACVEGCPNRALIQEEIKTREKQS